MGVFNMCQIHAITRKSYDTNTDKWEAHLRDGAKINSHGSAALFLDETTGNHSIIRSLNWDDIEVVLNFKDDWTHVFIHQRYGTRGGRGLENTHFWQANDVFYCHNGVFRGEEQDKFTVDSHVIGQYLEEHGVWSALEYMQSQEYSNTFMVDMVEGSYYISRSSTNSLFTDNSGCFSTRKLNDICDKTVPKYAVLKREFKLSPVYVSSWFDRQRDILDDADNDYLAAVNKSIHGDS